MVKNRACVFHRSPEKDYNVLVGDSVELRLRIKNCGDERGNFYSDIRKDGGTWIRKYNEWLDPGDLGTFLRKSFIMPNREVRVDFYGGHADVTWKEDFHFIAYLRPRKEYCTQEIEVKTKDGASVTATVDWGDGTSDSGTTPKTFSHQYEVVIGKSYEIKVSASGYYTESIWLTLPCKPKITSILPKLTETCSQNVRVVTSDGASVRARLDWGDGVHEDFYTPKTCFYDRYEKGKPYTVNASATGYTSVSKTITACVSQFTLTLKKEAAPTCDTYTTKSSCEAAGCFWYNNACHEYGPVKCSDYTDALTCVANNCYWWSDGTCHDTKEVAPPPPDVAKFRLSEVVENHLPDWISGYACAECWGSWEYKCPAGYKRTECVEQTKGSHGCCATCMVVFVKCKQVGVIYEECGRVPTTDDTKTYITNWWECAYAVGEGRGICHSDGVWWFSEVKKDIKTELGVTPYGLQQRLRVDGDYVKIWMGVDPKVYLGRFKWKCPAVVKKDTVICDFDVYDAAGKKVTDLVAGIGYWIRAYLCKVEGGGCAEILKGCDSGCEISGETLKLFLFGQAAEVASGTTNVDGYTAFFWTPSADLVPKVGIRLEFTGSAKYNASESETKTVTVSGLRIKCDCTSIDVGDYVFLNEVKKVLGKWVVTVVGGAARKTVTGDKVLYFTAEDGIRGFEVGKHYSVVAWKWWEYYIVLKPLLNFIVPDFAVIELKEGLNEVSVRYQVSIVGTTLCDFFGIDPESTECSMFLAEFADPVYVANLVSGWKEGKDLEGNTYHPTVFETALGGLIFIPFLPAGIVRRTLGPILKTIKKTPAKASVMDKNLELVFRATCKGDEGQLKILAGHLSSGNFDLAVKQAKEIIANPKVTREVTFGNFKAWLDDVTAHGWDDTRLLKAQADEIAYVAKKVADEFIEKSNKLAGNWGELKKLWVTTCKSSDEVLDLERNMARMHPDARAMHNLMRYTKDDYIKALKAEKAVVPEFTNRFDEGLDFLLRHIGEETGTEVARYREAIRGLSSGEVDAIVKNLDVAGQLNSARIIKTLKVDPARGMGFLGGAHDALKGIGKVSDKEGKAVSKILDTGIDDAVKHLDGNWKRIFTKMGDTEDSSRFWNYIRGHGKTKDMMGKYGVNRFRDLPFIGKAAAFMAAFYLVSTTWKTMQDFCFALFMGEETIQWGGFGGIVLNNLLYKFNEKPLSEKKQIIKTFEEFSEKRHTIHDLVTGSSSIFESLCLVFGDIFKRFWEADAVNLWALDTTIEYLNEGINPYTGIGECSIKVRANKDGVDFWYQGSPTKWHGGKAFSWTEIKLVPVRATPEEVTVCAWKAGYVMDTHIIKIFPEDVGKTGFNAKEMELFELIPESSVSTTPNPLGYQTPPDTTNLPTPYGNANPGEYFGDVIHGSIRCESIPTGAGVYLDVKDSAHYKGKTDITLEHIPVGAHKIIQTFPNFNDCVVNVNVVVEPVVYARCRFPTPTCSFTPSITKPKLNEVVTFDASASTPGTGAASLTYDWDWGDNKPHGTKKIETHSYVAKGVYAVKLTVTNELGGSKVCTTNITVEVAVGNIKCYCEPAEYCGRNADILVDGKKVDVTKASGYTYIKDLPPGVHTVKYNLLDVMECTDDVVVTADKDTIYKGVLALSEKVKSACSYDATNFYYKTVKVTKIEDGDSIFTDFTDPFPKPPLFPKGQQVRIAGYDSPDGATARTNAKEKLTELIPVGSSVTLKIWPPAPLGKLNRVLAGVFKGDVDIAIEMLKSCLVNESPYKGKDNFPWVDWVDYGRLWKDPVGKECLINPNLKPLITDIDTTRKTFKINNRWFTLDFTVRYEDEYGVQKGIETKKQVDGRKVSTPNTYAMGAYAIKLFACIEKCDKKENWILVDVGYVVAAPPTKKTVTFKSVPAGASVTVVKKETARLVKALKRVIRI